MPRMTLRIQVVLASNKYTMSTSAEPEARN